MASDEMRPPMTVIYTDLATDGSVEVPTALVYAYQNATEALWGAPDDILDGSQWAIDYDRFTAIVADQINAWDADQAGRGVVWAEAAEGLDRAIREAAGEGDDTRMRADWAPVHRALGR